MNLHERLTRFNNTVLNSPHYVSDFEATPHNELACRLHAKLCQNSSGLFLIKKTIYPLPDYNGFIRFHRDSYSYQGMARLLDVKENNPTYSLNELIFLDTETTGLAGGTGTFIFLVGLGYFQEDSFCVDQYFLLDYGEELGLLAELNTLLQKYTILVTYNGKAFDFPLLSTRYKFNRISPKFQFQWHLDLLHSTRRLWKRRLENCSLNQVEQSILGLTREHDISGEFIPQVYFDYVTKGDMELMPLVFEHNRQDIVSLAVLTAFISQCVGSPVNSNISHGLDYYSLGKYYLQYKEWDDAILSFQEALKYPLTLEVRYETLKELAFIHKRLKNWENALEIWKELSGGDQTKNWVIYEEIAKYYEHHKRDYISAINIIESYKFINPKEQKQMVSSNIVNFTHESVQKRLARLRQKIKNQNKNPQ